MQPPAAEWQRMRHHNCYNGAGATELHPSGNDVDYHTENGVGLFSVPACKAVCLAIVGCEAVVMTLGDHVNETPIGQNRDETAPGRCYLLADVVPSQCAQMDWTDLYLLVPPSPPPLPPSSPPAQPSPSTPPPSPSAPAVWVDMGALNCWEGAGGTEMDPFQNGVDHYVDPVTGQQVFTLDECKAACVDTIGCEGVIFEPGAGFCYRRADLDPPACQFSWWTELHMLVP